MGDRWNRMGRSLERSVEAYDGAVGSIEGRVLVSRVKFAELKTASLGVEIAEVEPVKKSVRALRRGKRFRPRHSIGSKCWNIFWNSGRLDGVSYQQTASNRFHRPTTAGLWCAPAMAS
jgi:hypothetical protein